MCYSVMITLLVNDDTILTFFLLLFQRDIKTVMIGKSKK